MRSLAVVLALALTASLPLRAQDGAAKRLDYVLSVRQEQAPAAEPYLAELALSSKRARKLGYVYLGAGAAMIGGGFALAAAADDSEDLEGLFQALGAVTLWAAGASCVVVGTASLVIASGPERRYSVIKDLPDAAQRERASREALQDLAGSGKIRRLVVAGLFSAVAAYALAAGDDPQAALAPGALAVYEFLVKTREERTYRRYLAGGGVPPERVSLGFGPGPHGGFRVSLAASF